jgi:hypothetical protein
MLNDSLILRLRLATHRILYTFLPHRSSSLAHGICTQLKPYIFNSAKICIPALSKAYRNAHFAPIHQGQASLGINAALASISLADNRCLVP